MFCLKESGEPALTDDTGGSLVWALSSCLASSAISPASCVSAYGRHFLVFELPLLNVNLNLEINVCWNCVQNT